MSKSGYTQSGQELQRQHANKPATAIATTKAFLETRVESLGKWVREGVRPDALVRFILLDMSNNPKLAACDPTSIYIGLLACAQTGLEPGALRGEAYLVPFANKAQFIAGYRGLIKQAKRSRSVHNLTANVVYDRDDFDLLLGTDQKLTHRPARGDRGAIVGAYAIASLAHGVREIEWMGIDDLERIKKVATSRGRSPAWDQWESEMMRKAPVRRLCKRLPMGSDYAIAQAIDDAHDEGRSTNDVIDVVTDGEASKATAAADRAPKAGIPLADEFDSTDVQPEDRQ